MESNKLRVKKVASSLLWGCSSGKLSVYGVHDPFGTAINYLLGGAKFVVGNLWDVTDKDLDKISVECMSKYLSLDNTSDFSEITHNSRSVCKLPYIVGCAPVVYGLSS